MKKFRKQKSVKELLISLKEGDSLIVPNKQMTSIAVRRVVGELRKEGYEIVATQRGYVNELKVTKYKNPTNNESI